MLWLIFMPFGTGYFIGASSSAGSVTITTVGTAAFDVDAAVDAALLCMSSLAGEIHADGEVKASVAGGLVVPTLSGDGGVRLTALGGGQAWLSSSAGPVEVFLDAAATLHVTATGKITIIACGAVNVTADGGAAVEVLAGGDVSGTIEAAGNATVLSLGAMTADVTAYDVAILGVELVQTAAHANHDLRVVSYGDLTADTLIYAGHDLRKIWARGDITGNFTAVNYCYDIISFAGVDANVTVQNNCLYDVICWDDLAGYYQTMGWIEALHSGHEITATWDSYDLIYFIENDHYLFGQYPDEPDISLAPVKAQLAGDLRDARELVRRLTTERDGQAAAWIAADDQTAAETAAFQADAAQAVTRAQAGMDWAAGAAQVELAAASAADGEMLNCLSALFQADRKLVLAGAAAAKSINQALLADLRCKLAQGRADVTANRHAGELRAVILQACASDALQARMAVLEQCSNEYTYEWRRLASERARQVEYWWAFDQDHASWYAFLQRFERGMTEGSLAGTLNVMDHLTYELIPSLHAYRNQVWQDIGLAGTGWETASNVAAWIGTEALYTAGFMKLFSLPRMQLGVGQGTASPYIHFIYGVGGKFQDAGGEKLFKLTTGWVRDGYLRKYLWFVVKIPVRYPDRVLERFVDADAWTCLGAALRAILRGWGL